MPQLESLLRALGIGFVWFVLNFVSFLIYSRWLLDPPTLAYVLGSLYSLQSWIVEHISFFDSWRDGLPGIGVLVSPLAVALVVIAQSLAIASLYLWANADERGSDNK